MHPDYKNLYFIGLFQPVGCIWPLADYQAKLACAEIVAKYQHPHNLKAAIQDEIDHPHFTFTGGTRHSTEVDYHAFRKELGHELKKAGINIGKPPPGNQITLQERTTWKHVEVGCVDEVWGRLRCPAALHCHLALLKRPLALSWSCSSLMLTCYIGDYIFLLSQLHAKF